MHFVLDYISWIVMYGYNLNLIKFYAYKKIDLKS